jgi:hypothetical protein
VRTVASRTSSGAPLGELTARGINAIREETAGGLWQEFGWELFEEPEPRTESSLERGFRLRGPVDDEWGRSESIDSDNLGDIADEGMRHRG